MTPNPVEFSQPQPAEQQNYWQAFILLTIGLVALSFTAIFIKLSVREISANATVFNRLWIATLVFGLWNLFSRKGDQVPQDLVANLPHSDTEIASKKDDQREIIMLILAVAIVHIIGRFLWTWSLTQTSAANGTVLSNLPPLFTTLGGWLFLGQRFDRRFLIGMAIALSGAITLGLGDMFAADDRLFSETAIIGDGAAFLSSMFYAASFLIVERLRTKIATENILIWRCAIGTLLMTPIVLAVEDPIFPVSAIGWFAVFGLAAISEVIGHGLIVYSLKHFSSAFVTVFLLLEPVLTACFAWVIFAETLGSTDLIGFILILQGIYLAKTGKGGEKDDHESAQIAEVEAIE